MTHRGVTFVAVHDGEPMTTVLLRRSGDGDPRTAAFAAVAEETATLQVEIPNPVSEAADADGRYIGIATLRCAKPCRSAR